MTSAPEKKAKTLINVGRAYYYNKPSKLPEALQEFERAQTILSAMPHPPAPLPEEVMHRLCEIYSLQGKNEKIISTCRSWESYLERTKGPLDPKILFCREQATGAAIVLRQYVLAETTIKRNIQAFAVAKKPLPASLLPAYVNSTHLLLSAYENQGKWTEAQGLLLERLKETDERDYLRQAVFFTQFSAEVGWFAAHGPANLFAQVSATWKQSLSRQHVHQ